MADKRSDSDAVRIKRGMSVKTKRSSPWFLSLSYSTQTGEGPKRNTEKIQQSSAREIRQMPSFTS